MKKKSENIMKVDVSRRRALGLFGGGAVAVAALPVTDLTKIKTGFGAAGNTLNIEALGDDETMMEELGTRLLDMQKALKYFTDNGIPKFKKDQLKREAKDLYQIEPNIAALHSVSLVGKASMQSKRNYKKALVKFQDDRVHHINDLVHRIKTKMSIDVW